MAHQLNIALFIIVSAIAVTEAVYWTIVVINRLMDFIFTPKQTTDDKVNR